MKEEVRLMAVKVMVAPAIAQGRLQARKPHQAGSKAKARRSSVYDADGNEVFITLMCLKCHKMRPLSQFGLRKMADGAIRNQPWCRTCRSGAGSAVSRKRGEPAVEAGALEAEAATAPAAPAAPERPVPAGTVAAQVAAAIVWAK
jgi:hypothetical protein